MRKVFFVGPLPPPVHGFSVINGHMLAGMQDNGARVEVFDMAPRNLLAPLLKWLAFLTKLLTPSPSTGKTLYLPFSGGKRQLVDLAFALPAKWLGFGLFVHHHSFAYLNATPWVARFALAVLKGATHVALCPAMGQRLCQQYGIAPSRVRVLSNAAFLECPASTGSNDAVSPSHLTLGFLSNITAEKGIFSFFDALDGLRAKQIPFDAVIAGPVSPEVKAQFDARLAASVGVKHVGAVYGEAKNQFFAKLDLLLFPTLYANEAEPVTLWEAMAHGVPVIALQRGCIQGMVPADAGRVVLAPSIFTSAVEEEVVAMSSSPSLRRSRRIAARAAFEAAQLQSKAALKSLLEEMTASAGEAAKK